MSESRLAKARAGYEGYVYQPPVCVPQKPIPNAGAKIAWAWEKAFTSNDMEFDGHWLFDKLNG